MNKYINPDKSQWPTLISRPVFKSEELIPKVQDILSLVKTSGDSALKSLGQKFDGLALDDFQVNESAFDIAIDSLDDSLKLAIQQAASNIQKFHSEQLPKLIRTETTPGVLCWQKAVPIQKVGLYIPGGSAPLFSTVLMLAIPAQIAGCPEIIICTPADKKGRVHPAILYAARLTGITKVYRIGGAQAIAAMAYGTESIPKVDKIFGPGNQYVTTAKQLVSAEGIAIDMPAGPSEVMVVVDQDTPVKFAAADLLSQAEHGPDSQVILLSDSAEKLSAIQLETEQQLKNLPRQEIAKQALQHSRFICFNDKSALVEFMNAYAPEHLILSVTNPGELAEKVTQAGSVFLGNYTPESAGDYASGTNHTLPTNGFARAFSGVNMDSFMKKITFQQITPDGLKNLGPTIELMAEAEQLVGHKNAVTVRLLALNNQKE